MVAKCWRCDIWCHQNANVRSLNCTVLSHSSKKSSNVEYNTVKKYFLWHKNKFVIYHTQF